MVDGAARSNRLRPRYPSGTSGSRCGLRLTRRTGKHGEHEFIQMDRLCTRRCCCWAALRLTNGVIGR
jgi:hypothetical protein